MCIEFLNDYFWHYVVHGMAFDCEKIVDKCREITFHISPGLKDAVKNVACVCIYVVHKCSCGFLHIMYLIYQ
jgi:hypothetical protein